MFGIRTAVRSSRRAIARADKVFLQMNHALRFGAALLAVASNAAHAVDYFGPTPYLSTLDTPAGFASGAMTIEDVEDGVLDARLSFPLVVEVALPSSLTDSVDADDGAIDGSGTSGRSIFRAIALIEVVFAPPLPVSAGLVWTDGGSSTDVTFEAFGANGLSLGSFGPFTLGDNSNFGSTAEDRFFGARDAGGITRLRVSHTSGGIEIDHIQYSAVDALFADGFDGGGVVASR
jgi:hypothetical protein